MPMVSKFLKLAMLGAFTALASGCGSSSPSFSLLPASQSFQQTQGVFNNKLDILWVVDNSGSMQPFQQNVANNFSSFISSFQSKGYDFHIGITTTDAYRAGTAFQNNATLSLLRDGTNATSHTGVFIMLPNTPNLNSVFVTDALQGANGSGDERAFSSFRETLNNPGNSGFLRANSFLAVIILSDEDDFSSNTRSEGSLAVPDHDYAYSGLDTVASYVSYLDTLTSSTGATRRYDVSAIEVLDQNCYNSHYAASGGNTIIGQRYIDLATQTNGVTADICSASYATALDQIQTRIAELSTQFILNRTPIQSSIVIHVNGVLINNDPTNGWTYNPAANSIVFHGTAIPPQNAAINVNFDPTTIQ